MSYNIDTVEYLKGQLFITREKAAELIDKYKGEWPECCFLDDMNFTPGLDNIPIKYPYWCHEGSGSSYDQYLDVLTFTNGKADILLVWEGGDTISGLTVRDGVVKEKNVKFKLVD